MGRVRKQHNSKELASLVKNISFKLKTFRQKAGVSQNELSRESGVAASTINEIENQLVGDLRLSTICQLAKSLRKDPVEFLGGSDLSLSDPDRREFAKAIAILSRLNHRLK